MCQKLAVGIATDSKEFFSILFYSANSAAGNLPTTSRKIRRRMSSIQSMGKACSIIYSYSGRAYLPLANGT
jgi:hypothetical protein